MISFTQKFYFAHAQKKKMLFQAKQALVLRAMYQSAFLDLAILKIS